MCNFHHCEFFVKFLVRQVYTFQRQAKIYPTDVLSPLNFGTGLLNITENTYAIHHYTATWFNDEQRDKRKMNQQNLKQLSGKFVD